MAKKTRINGKKSPSLVTAGSILSLTPRFSGVASAPMGNPTVLTVFGCQWRRRSEMDTAPDAIIHLTGAAMGRKKTVETVGVARSSPLTPLKRGVNEIRYPLGATNRNAETAAGARDRKSV